MTAVALASAVVLSVVSPAKSVIVSAQDLPALQSAASGARIEAFARALREDLPYVPGEVLVSFKDDVSAASQTAALRVLRAGATPMSGRWQRQTLLVTGIADDPAQAAERLREQPEVKSAEPNYLRRPSGVPNDASYSRQWNMDQIRMPVAWDINRTAGAGVTVAVLDTGFTTFEGTFGVRLPAPPTFTTVASFAVPFTRPPDFDHSKVLPGAEFTMTG